MTLGQWEYYYRELLWLNTTIAKQLDVLIRELIIENERLKGIR
jgi:hypothetical protein